VGLVTGAATGGAGAGYALAVIVVWLLTMAGVAVPDNVSDAIGLLFTIGLGLLGGWLVPPGAGQRRGG